MNKEDYYSRSENHLKKSSGRKNHLTKRNIKEQYQETRGFKRIRKR